MNDIIKELVSNGELTPYILTLLNFLKVPIKDVVVDTIKEKIKKFFSKNKNSSNIDNLIKELKEIKELENITSHDISNAFNQTFNHISNSHTIQNINSNNNTSIQNNNGNITTNNITGSAGFVGCKNLDKCKSIGTDNGFVDCENLKDCTNSKGDN